RGGAAYALATAYADGESAHRGLGGLVTAVFVSSEAAGQTLTWPMPSWPTLDQFLSFVDRWERSLPDVEPNDPTRLTREYSQSVIGAFGVRDGGTSWKTLGDAVLKATDRAESLRRWIEEGLPLLATPEAGLPADVANAVLELWLDVAATAPSEVAVR